MIIVKISEFYQISLKFLIYLTDSSPQFMAYMHSCCDSLFDFGYICFQLALFIMKMS